MASFCVLMKRMDVRVHRGGIGEALADNAGATAGKLQKTEAASSERQTALRCVLCRALLITSVLALHDNLLISSLFRSEHRGRDREACWLPGGRRVSGGGQGQRVHIVSRLTPLCFGPSLEQRAFELGAGVLSARWVRGSGM